MLRTLIGCAFLASCCLASTDQPVAEASASPRPLSLVDCLQIALQHNLALEVSRLGPEIQRHQLSQARAIYDPTLDISGVHRSTTSPGGIDEQNRPFPGTNTESDAYRAGITGRLPTGASVSVGVDFADTSGTTSSGTIESASGTASIQVRQPLLRNAWTDSGRLTLKISKNQLAMSELALRSHIMDIMTAVETAYYDLLFAHRRVAIQQEALALAERLATGSRRRVEVGTEAQLAEQQAESQTAARRADLLGAQGTLRAQEFQLKSLLGDNLAEWHSVGIVLTDTLTVVPRSFDLMESWRIGLELRLDLREARLDLENQGYVLNYRKNQLLPQLDLVGSYGQLGSDRDRRGAWADLREGDNSFYSAGVVVSIPLGNRAARASYRLEQAEMNRSLLEYKRLEQDIMVQIGVALEQARTRLAQVEATGRSRRFAETALAGEQQKLENGRSTGFVVLQLQRELTMARLAETSALTEYNKSLALLALREGTTLERNRAVIEVDE